MKKIFSVALLFSCVHIGIAQKNSDALLLSGGKSWHGTGDFDGVIAGVDYVYTFHKRLDLSTGLVTTIHWGRDRDFNSYSTNTSRQDRQLRFTVAGLQLAPVLNFTLLYTSVIQLKIGAGPMLRFQSSAYPDIYASYQDPSVFPEPFYTLDYREKQNIITAGYTVNAIVTAHVSPKFLTGLKASFQNDTNGDVITSISLLIGKRL